MTFPEIAKLHSARLASHKMFMHQSVKAQRIAKMVDRLQGGKPIFQPLKLPQTELIPESRLGAPITRDRAPDRWNINHGGMAG